MPPNDQPLSDSKIKVLVSQIYNGKSLVKSKRFQSFYVKHLTTSDSALVENNYDVYYKEFVDSGFFTEKEKFAYLEKEGLWDESREYRIFELKDGLERLQITKSKVFREAEIAAVSKEIVKYAEQLEALQAERFELVGVTAEIAALRKQSNDYIYHVCFKDEDLKVNLFNLRDFDDLEEEDLDALSKEYNTATQYFGDKFLKRVAISPIFLNFFYLSDDNPHQFYGKPIINLTYYQVELFRYGKLFKFIFSNSKDSIPKEIQNDPDELISWFERNKNVEEKLSSKNGPKPAHSLVGLSRKDKENLNIDTSNSSYEVMVREAEKRGGSLNAEDLIKIMNR